MENTYEIADLYYAAALVGLGKTVVGLRKDEIKSGRCVFVFERGEDDDDRTLRMRRDEFTQRKMLVEPITYNEHIRHLKDMSDRHLKGEPVT